MLYFNRGSNGIVILKKPNMIIIYGFWHQRQQHNHAIIQPQKV